MRPTAPPSLAPDAEPLAPGLYIVATPIGNLADITLRALRVLRGAALVACEDTRVTGRLLNHFGIKARAAPVALASDAGTPLVSDPGYRLVREARAAGVPVTAVPGPCAAIAALAIAGLPSDRFFFAGFLPARDGARRAALEELSGVAASLVFYETAPRLLKSLHAIAALWPGREVAVARELTKLHEECRSGSAAALAEHYGAHPPKGEIVLIVGPPAGGEAPAQGAQADSAPDTDALLRAALAHAGPGKAAGKVARATGLDRAALYARALELKGE